VAVDKQFKQILSDRFEAWELAEFLQISTEDFVEMFEEEIENNYEDLCDFIGIRGGGDNSFDDDDVYS
jgi:hypothetical protein